MKTIRIDAKQLMENQNPVESLCTLLECDPQSLDELKKTLQEREEYLLVEVGNWPVPKDPWPAIGDMLEAVQQHSEYFFLVWGTDQPVQP